MDEAADTTPCFVLPEQAGQWELALELFNEMAGEGCVPNTVTFNSLITACAQGACCAALR